MQIQQILVELLNSTFGVSNTKITNNDKINAITQAISAFNMVAPLSNLSMETDPENIEQISSVIVLYAGFVLSLRAISEGAGDIYTALSDKFYNAWLNQVQMLKEAEDCEEWFGNKE